MSALKFDQDKWLSEVLLLPCWRVSRGEDERVDADFVKSQIRHHSAGGPGFFFIKEATFNVQPTMQFVRSGFSIVDVNVTLDLDKTARSPMPITADIGISAAAPADFSDIEDLADRCFLYSRFHLDPRMSSQQANAIKRSWAANACRGRAPIVYAARVQGRLAGFLAVLEVNSAHGRDAVIDLVGVDADFRGRGIGRALSQTFIRDFSDRADRLRVGTQISNIPALRLYEALGFRTSSTSYVLHAHSCNGEILQ